jgi:sporulation protein YlmC with PRC-barrel domain
MMDIPINAEVKCSDGSGGHTCCIIVNPFTKKITHVVVKEKPFPHIERLVPEGFIIRTSPNSIQLNCSKADLSTMEEFIGYRFTRFEPPPFDSPDDLTPYWPYDFEEEQTITTKEEHIPPGELVMHRGAIVEATDGPVGQVEEFLVNPSDGKITHLILREGQIWGPKDVAIPVSQIDHLEADMAYLKLEKDNVKKLPAIPERRWSL